MGKSQPGIVCSEAFSARYVGVSNDLILICEQQILSVLQVWLLCRKT
jgi:hypothetical protein